MSRENRIALIKEIQQKRNSIVLVYITSDRPNLQTMISADIVPILHDHLLELNPKENSNIDLFIYSRGGDSDIPWSIVSMIREYCPKGSYNILIPYRAHSAASMIALGADEIVMTKKAELGPIDITINDGPYNPSEKENHQRLPVSVEDVIGYFSLLSKTGCEKEQDKTLAFSQLTNQVHPLVLGTVSRLLDQTRLVAERLLNTRKKSFTEEENTQIVKKLSSEIYSHRHAISRTEAITQLGLKQIIKAEDANIDLEMWQLYKEYKDYFSLEDPFRPEDYLIQKNLDENEWTDLKLVCVETEKRTTSSLRNIKVRKIKQIPPQVTLSLSNLSFPAINVQNLPPEITIDQVNAIVQKLIPAIITPIINNAVEASTKNYLELLPTLGFERQEYNVHWMSEV